MSRITRIIVLPATIVVLSDFFLTFFVDELEIRNVDYSKVEANILVARFLIEYFLEQLILLDL